MFRFLTLSVAASAAFFSTAKAVHAQTPSLSYQQMQAKGQTLVRTMQSLQASRPSSSSASTATSTHSATVTQHTPAAVVHIAISVPNTTRFAPAAVAIRGPDGEVRTFSVAGGREALQTGAIVVRRGETVTIALYPAK